MSQRKLISPTRVAALVLAFSCAGAPSVLAASGGAGVAGTAGYTASSHHASTNDDNSGSGSSSGAESGGTGFAPSPTLSTAAQPTVPGIRAKIIHGVAYAPSFAPLAVKKAIWAGNQIRTKPYIWGGGHEAFKASGYDCSGSVSYLLHAAGLLRTPDDSSSFMSWGRSGVGQWITVYTNPGHAFVQIAGIRLDTSAESDPHPAPGSGPRWRPIFHGQPSGFDARHPSGY